VQEPVRERAEAIELAARIILASAAAAARWQNTAHFVEQVAGVSRRRTQRDTRTRVSKW
jgi:hypothetical protein